MNYRAIQEGDIHSPVCDGDFAVECEPAGLAVSSAAEFPDDVREIDIVPSRPQRPLHKILLLVDEDDVLRVFKEIQPPHDTVHLLVLAPALQDILLHQIAEPDSVLADPKPFDRNPEKLYELEGIAHEEILDDLADIPASLHEVAGNGERPWLHIGIHERPGIRIDSGEQGRGDIRIDLPIHLHEEIVEEDGGRGFVSIDEIEISVRDIGFMMVDIDKEKISVFVPLSESGQMDTTAIQEYAEIVSDILEPSDDPLGPDKE